jgi:hypothetical protein
MQKEFFQKICGINYIFKLYIMEENSVPHEDGISRMILLLKKLEENL